MHLSTLKESTENPNPIAKAELNLLAHLMGGTDDPSKGTNVVERR
jgi:hypothetical protein